MEFIRRPLGFEDTDIAPKVTVYRTAKLIGRKPLTRDMNVRNLALRMHAGVGSTGANNTNIRIYEHPDHPLQLTLNGPVILLHLPTMEVGAVVLD